MRIGSNIIIAGPGSNSSTVYNFVDKTQRAGGSLNTIKGWLGMGRMGDHNLAFGGSDIDNDLTPLDEVEEWDEAAEEWTDREETLKIPRYGFGSVSVPESVICMS